METQLTIKQYGDYIITTADITHGENYSVCGNALYATMLVNGECLECVLKERETLRQQSEWIPVSERLPENNAHVIVFSPLPETQTPCEALWHDGDWWYEDNGSTKWIYNLPTHWRPLPEPPTKG